LFDEDAETGIMGKRKGTHILSFSSSPGEAVTMRKTRGQPARNKPALADVSTRSTSTTSSGSASNVGSEMTRDLHSGSSATTNNDSQQHEATLQDSNGQSMRNISTSTLRNAFADLSLSPRPAHRSTSLTKHQPSLSLVKEEPITSPSKIPKFSCTPSLRTTQSVQCLRAAPQSPLKHKSSVNGLRTPVNSVRSKAMDEIPVFLTKEKLTPISYTAWDIKGRLEDMEQSYSKLRSEFASADESKTMIEEKCEVYRTRGKL